MIHIKNCTFAQTKVQFFIEEMAKPHKVFNCKKNVNSAISSCKEKNYMI